MRTGKIRLDQALQKVAKSDVKPTEKTAVERFAPLWRGRDRRNKAVGRKGLVDVEFDYIMPQLSDSSSMHGADYLQALEGLLENLDQDEEGKDELDDWAKVIIRHEVKKYRLLWQYMNSLVG